MFNSPLAYMFGVMAVLLVFKVAIPFALGFSCVVYLYAAGAPIALIAQQFIVKINTFTLLAVPFFILAGQFMSRGGIMRRLIAFSECIIGHIAGGLAHVNILTSMILAGMSGAAVSDAAMTSMILVPEMEREGYPRPYAAAVTGASATIGPIIPPSIPMVVVGVMNELSIGRLFLGGVVPGLIVGGTMMLLVVYHARRRGFPKREKRAETREILRATVDALPAFSLPVIILGGILTGFVTPTEAAVLAALVAFLLAAFHYREMKFPDLVESIVTTVKVSANVMIIIGFAGVFGWILTAEQFAYRFGQLISSVTTSPVVFLLLVNILVFVMGMFINVTPNIILLSPVLFPLASAFGVDAIHLGVILVVNLMIGQLTPPVGLVSFAVVDAANVSFDDYLRELWPFVGVLAIAVLLVTYIPETVLWLPRLVFD